MNVTLWVLQILLATVFFGHGCLLVFAPPAIAAQLNTEYPRGFWVLLGWAEILAAAGLTLPGVIRILSRLVPAAAVGLTLVMICATVFHFIRGEYSSTAITAVLLAMTAFVAYSRSRIAPIAPR